jgi:hypothetical protein
VIGLFQERNPFLVPVLLVITLVFKFSFITHPLPSELPSSGGILDEWLYGIWWKKLHPSLLASISILILFFTGLFFNYLLTEKRMYQRSHLVTALSIVLLSSLFAGVQRMQPGIIMLPITLILYSQTLRLYNASSPKTIVTNIGLLAGSGVLLYHPFWWMLPYCFLSLAIMRPFKLNEWVLLVISFLIPAYCLLSYEYLTDQWKPEQHWPVWNPIKEWPSFNAWWAIAIAVVLIWTIDGFVKWQKSNLRMLIQNRKNWSLLLLLGLFILPSLFYPKGNVHEGLTLLLLPIGAFATYSFLGTKRKWYHLFFFWLLVSLVGLLSWAFLNNLA